MNKSISPVLLEVKNIIKSFPGVKALNGVNLTVKKGEVHALLGENGAGKSTFIKILSGAYAKDGGEIFWSGEAVNLNSPREAQYLGISTIYQEFNLSPNLSVFENIFLGKIPRKGMIIDNNLMKIEAQKILQSLGLSISEKILAKQLSIAEQQLVEIAKALNNNTKLLIMDEPSAVLGDKDLERLFGVVKRLQEKGIGIIYISHRLDEIFDLANRVTVFKDGQYIETCDVSSVTKQQLIKLMVGRNLKEIYPIRNYKQSNIILDVQNISRENILKNISLQLYKQEILGIAGLIGSGRTELARVIFGADKYKKGTMKINNELYQAKSPKDAIKNGIFLVTEDRKQHGLFLQLSMGFNTSISSLKKLTKIGVIKSERENDLINNSIENLHIKTPNSQFPIVNMSGGNQQKVILARWLYLGVKVFIFDEPTRGIDVGSKAEIYQIMNDLTEKGASIIMISSELPEILGMSDRILVMNEGKIAKELTRKEANEERILSHAMS